MKLTKNFQAALIRYLEWSKCTTPLKGMEVAEQRTHFRKSYPAGITPPEEIIFARETHGICTAEGCSDPELLSTYERGKAMRDYWTKEIGWWKKWAAFLPEDFLVHLTDECFYEIFGRYPILEIVRFRYDNHYTYTAFRADMWIRALEHDGRFSLRGFERDDRLPWWKTAILAIWNLDDIVRVKRRMDAWFWKIKHLFCLTR
jgi:hypothetical protein